MLGRAVDLVTRLVCAIHYIELLNNTFAMPAMSKLHYWPVLKPVSLLPFNSGPKYPGRDHNRWGICPALASCHCCTYFWGEPERAPQLLVSIARACVCTCVRTYVRGGVRCLEKTFINKAKGYRKENWVKKKESRAKVH